jgi:hypothetical protein
MRTPALVSCFALAVSLAACGDDSSSTEPDMSASAQTCAQIVSCIENNCTTPGLRAACAVTCASNGTSKAQTEYQAGITCGYGVCTKPGDGGAAACASMTDNSPGCLNCVVDAVQAKACSTQLQACLNGT